MPLKELVKQLNDHIKTVDFSKIRNHTDFHILIENSISYLLLSGLNINLWRININDDVVITYDRDFVSDKRCRENSRNRGKFSNIRFIAQDNLPNLEINDLKNYFKVEHLKERIDELEKDIKKSELELIENKKTLKNLKGELE